MADSNQFNAVLARMLARVPDGIDRREGSILYDALAPTALALAGQSYMLGYLTNLLFADTSEGEWLDRITHDFGIDRRPATHAVRGITCVDQKGAGMAGLVGKKFSIHELSFQLTKASTGGYEARCEQDGERGNCYVGAVLPVDHIAGLGVATLAPEPLVAARDREGDDALRARFYEAVRRTPFGGNKADYRERTLGIDGVGACAIFGAPDMPTGAGNVGVVIGDAQGGKASDLLVAQVQALFATEGDGLAPIGHTVMVKAASELGVNVIAAVRLRSGTSFEVVKLLVLKAISETISGIAFDEGAVFYAKLVAAILNAHGAIVDVGTVTLNGASVNLALSKSFAAYQVPKLGVVTITEVTG